MSDFTARFRLTGEATSWVAAAEQARAGMDRLAASEKKAETGAHAASGALTGVGQAGVRAGAGLNTAASGGDRFERSARMAHSAGALLGTTLAFLGGREMVRGITDAAFAVQGFDSGFKVTAGGAANAAAEIAWVTSEAERLGVPLRAAETGFMGLTASTMGTAVAGQRTRDVWVAMTEAGQVLHTGTAKQNLAMTAMAQIASKGVVSLEDLKGQLAESLPGALDVASEAMGVSRGELLKLVGEGKVLSDDFIPKFADALHNRFGPALEEAMNTPLGKARREMAATENALFSLQSVGGEAFLTGVTSGLAGLNAELTDPEARAAARELGHDLGEMVGTAAAGLGGLVDHIKDVETVAKLLVAVGLAKWLSTTAGAAGDYINTARREAAAAAQAAVAHEANAAAVVLEAQAQLKASRTYQGAKPSTTALTVAQRELTLAQNASALASGNAARAMTGGGAASIGLRGALGGLVAFMGGPLGITLAAVGVAVWGVSEAMAEAKWTQDALRESTEQGDEAMAAAEGFLRSAGYAAREFGDSNAGAVKGTYDLAAATFHLANATAELARQKIDAAISANNEKIAKKEHPGWLTTAWEFMSDAANADLIQMTPDGAQYSPTAKRKAEADSWRAENARLLAESIRLSMAPPSLKPDTPTRPASTTTLAGKDTKSDAEKEAQRRIETAQRMTLFAKAETEALIARSAAASKGEQALEDLRVVEARLAATQQLGVTSLDSLTGAVKAEAEAAVAAAEAKERQAIATEKAERVASSLRDLDSRAGEERAYAAALAGGERALVDFTVAEQVRQEVERTGKTLLPEQIKAIREKTEALFSLQAASEIADDRRSQAEDLRLAAMTADEREREVRAIALRSQYLREDLTLTLAEADARARIVASYEQEAQRRAKDISALKTQLRDAYVESGELGFDAVGEYAEKRLREAIYDALLAKPIDIVINAAVNIVGDIAGQVAGQVLGGIGRNGAAGSGGGLGSILGSLGSLGSSGGLGSLGGIASGIGSMLGLGGGGAAAIAGPAAASSAAGAGLMGSAGGLMAALGPIGLALGAVALIGGLVKKKESNHGARATFGADGSFVVDGNKRTDQTNAAATSAATGVQALIASLQGLGINAGGIITQLGVGTRDSSSLKLNTGEEIKTAKGDVEALLEAAGKALLDRASYEDPQMQALVDQMLAANQSFKVIAEKLDKFVEAQGFREDAKMELLRHTDQRAYTLAALDRDQKARRDIAESYGKDGLYSAAQLAEVRATLDALDDVELAEALERLGDAATEAERAFQNARDGYRQWIDRMTQSAAAPLNPAEQRQLAMAQYERQLEKARAHDPEAAAGLTGYADRLISADLNATSSAQDRLALWNKVMGDIEGLATPTAATTQDAIAALTTANTQITLQASETIVTALTEPGGVVASIDDQTSAIIRGLAALGDSLGARLDGLAGLTGNGMAEMVRSNLQTWTAVSGLADEQRLANTYARQVAARA